MFERSEPLLFRSQLSQLIINKTAIINYYYLYQVAYLHMVSMYICSVSILHNDWLKIVQYLHYNSHESSSTKRSVMGNYNNIIYDCMMSF